jgi:hypothetical protein
MAMRVLWLPSLVALVFATGCIDDVNTEEDVPAEKGATQPETSGKVIAASEACSRLVAAETAARDDLNCDSSPGPECPERLRLFGSLVCSEIDEGSVDACVDAIGAYRSCGEFDSRPCVVTVIESTCKNPMEAGVPVPEAGSDASLVPEGGVAEGGAPTPDAAPPDATAPADAATD